MALNHIFFHIQTNWAKFITETSGQLTSFEIQSTAGERYSRAQCAIFFQVKVTLGF